MLAGRSVGHSVSHFYRTEIILPSITNNNLKRHESALYEHIRQVFKFRTGLFVKATVLYRVKLTVSKQTELIRPWHYCRLVIYMYIYSLAIVEPYKEHIRHVVLGGGAMRRQAALAQPPSP